MVPVKSVKTSQDITTRSMNAVSVLYHSLTAFSYWLLIVQSKYFSVRNSLAFNMLFWLMLSKNCQRLRIVLLLKWLKLQVFSAAGGWAMIYLWMFLALCIVCVSGYIGQVLNMVSAISSFFGMVILAALIYYFTMWLTGGNELVTGIFMFLAPACGLMIRFMVGYGRR